MLRTHPSKSVLFRDGKNKTRIIHRNGFATATGLSAMMEGDISHDQMTRFLASKAFTSKDRWGQVKATVRQIEREDGCLIFDDTIQEKAWTDEKINGVRL